MSLFRVGLMPNFLSWWEIVWTKVIMTREQYVNGIQYVCLYHCFLFTNRSTTISENFNCWIRQGWRQGIVFHVIVFTTLPTTATILQFTGLHNLIWWLYVFPTKIRLVHILKKKIVLYFWTELPLQHTYDKIYRKRKKWDVCFLLTAFHWNCVT